jgi:hypothetical protein
MAQTLAVSVSSMISVQNLCVWHRVGVAPLPAMVPRFIAPLMRPNAHRAHPQVPSPASQLTKVLAGLR